MSVQSLSYVLFLPLVWLLVWLMPERRPRQWLLLLFSYAFYATWGLKFLGLLLASSLANYALGEWLRRKPSALRLWFAIGFNVLLLVAFRYLPAMTTKSPLSDFAIWIGIPVGISFWTFEALSYLLDLYRGEELNPSFVEFCLFLAFWPTVLSGPVCRLPDMLPQFRQLRWSWDDLAEGTHHIVIGLFMKIVLAQVLASGLLPGQGVSSGFDQLASGWGGLDVWILAFGYGFQLFFDFAGYSHIAIGAARLFGIHLPQNFNDPYVSTTPSEFWTRWHMSLSFWIRDYVFLPLAQLGSGMAWRFAAIFLSMLIFGVWHGATLLFLLWGCYHGLLLVLHRTGQELSRHIGPSRWPRVLTFVGWGVTFVLINLGWILFRANSLTQAAKMFRAVFSPSSYRHVAISPNLYLVTTLIIIGYFTLYALRMLARSLESKRMERLTWTFSPAFYSAIILSTIMWSTHKSLFVYLRF